jgi:hypothetical protein
VCNAPKTGDEERTGLGGGYNERENVEYIEREESDGEYDEVRPFSPGFLRTPVLYRFSGGDFHQSRVFLSTLFQFGRKKKKYRKPDDVGTSSTKVLGVMMLRINGFLCFICTVVT